MLPNGEKSPNRRVVFKKTGQVIENQIFVVLRARQRDFNLIWWNSRASREDGKDE